ncbi:large conductance mechanosensitive channel protein MscL [Ferruginibacter albus]|uniref:large conductance mechanosensitive channel protein MscL n=1 Tax=Ferruginibacter albus TaxID=2875540 RepID=UPI001CC6A188|nr:large conductance mechanosensitive channel protein MscL [Ferruginibacter albus]UAY51755.1 large conductance mechanosensitive channel protein MscL [Ferruginibacter albus]
MGFIKEFKEFALKGNVVDLAVAVVIGGAFGKIVDSLVGDIIMPIIGKICGDTNFFQKWAIDGIAVGKFLQAAFNFLIIALALFMVIKAINASKKKEVETTTPPAPSSTDQLLMEIRDALKK